MNIPQEIERIIDKRHRRAERMERVEMQLRTIRETMRAFRALRTEINHGGSETLAAKLNEIAVDGFTRDCDKLSEEIRRLRARFSREQIHISFVGKARQGKSLVMQKISGLGSNIIPSAAGDHCTGTKSVITNENIPEVSAQIVFYTANEIVGIVNDYLTAIFGPDEPKIHQPEDIPALAARRLETRMDPSHAVSNSRFKHLQRYISHYHDYMSLLGRNEVRQITVGAEEIETYVAQYQSDNPSVRYYRYLGVREAKIHCRFPAHDTCGSVALVDTIGLGDTSIGAEEEMIRAIRENSDAIIYMFRPDTKGPVVDAQHYQIIENIARQISVEYAKEMLFWVVNRDVTGGQIQANQISALAGDIEDARRRGQVPVRMVLDVDCTDAADVETHLLAPILEQLSTRLDSIDALLAGRVQSALDELFQRYQTLTQQLQATYSKESGRGVSEDFEPDIENAYNRWTKSMEQLCDERKKSRFDENQLFSQAFEDNIRQTVTLIPSQTRILEMFDTLGGAIEPHSLCNRAADALRTDIINSFLRLDGTLDELVRELKTRIVHILADPEQGRLGGVIPLSDGMDPDEWLTQLSRLAEERGYDLITQAVDALREFHMSVKAFFIFAVRNGLDPIDPRLHEEIRVAGRSDDERAANIYHLLKRQMFDIQRQIREECRNYISFPNSALYAAARDFWDRAVFAVPVLERTSSDIENQWKHFYAEHIPEIWPEKFAEHTAASRTNQQLGELVRTLRTAAEKDAFRL